MKNKILLVNDNMFNHLLKNELENKHNFDVNFINWDPQKIIESVTWWVYDALIMDWAIFPNWYFTQEQLVSFQKKFWSKTIDENMKIPEHHDHKWNSLTLKNIIDENNLNNDLNNVELWRNIGFGIYDKIRQYELDSWSVKKIPIIFYTVRNIHNLFITWVLDSKNTFYIKKPELTNTIAQKIKEILSSTYQLPNHKNPSILNININDANLN
jgi:hypothetical protein